MQGAGAVLVPVLGDLDRRRVRCTHGFGQVLAERAAAIVLDDPHLVIADSIDSKFAQDRKSTRLNSSHQIISYAVFSLKKNNTPLPAAHPPPPSHTPLLTPHPQ